MQITDRIYAIQQMQVIESASWDDYYLSASGDVKSRCFFWKIAKWLHLDCFPCVRQAFARVDADILGARQVILERIQKIETDEKGEIDAQTKDLILRVTLKLNALFTHINEKRANNAIPLLPVPGTVPMPHSDVPLVEVPHKTGFEPPLHHDPIPDWVDRNDIEVEDEDLDDEDCIESAGIDEYDHEVSEEYIDIDDLPPNAENSMVIPATTEVHAEDAIRQAEEIEIDPPHAHNTKNEALRRQPRMTKEQRAALKKDRMWAEKIFIDKENQNEKTGRQKK